VGHYRYHLCHLHWDSDIPWKPGWDQCYLVELSGERVFFIGSIHGHVFRGFGGGIYSRPSFNSFQVVYLGIPSFHINCVPVRRMVFGEGLSGLRAGCQ